MRERVAVVEVRMPPRVTLQHESPAGARIFDLTELGENYAPESPFDTFANDRLRTRARARNERTIIGELARTSARSRVARARRRDRN